MGKPKLTSRREQHDQRLYEPPLRIPKSKQVTCAFSHSVRFFVKADVLIDCL